MARYKIECADVQDFMEEFAISRGSHCTIYRGGVFKLTEWIAGRWMPCPNFTATLTADALLGVRYEVECLQDTDASWLTYMLGWRTFPVWTHDEGSGFVPRLMGHRNPDRVSLSARRVKCETVGDMFAQGWKLRAKCQTCALEMDVDMRVIAFHVGSSYSLWNKVGRCKKVGCFGKAVFLGLAPGMAGYEPLTTPKNPPPDEKPAWLRNRGPN
jgi:hypothetical protein